MDFTPFIWFVEIASIVLQFAVFLSGKGPRSFRYLMIFLIIGNVIAISTHNFPRLYWNTLWLCRSIWMCWALWLVCRMFTDKPRPFIDLVPSALNAALLFVRYWPLDPAVSTQDLENFRSFGFGLALCIAVIGFVALLPKGEAGPLHVGLIAFLGAECSAALIGRFLDVEPGIQLVYWMVSMAVLLAVVRPRSSSDVPRSHLPGPQHEQACG